MSDDESPARDDIVVDSVLDTERIIAEVELRPALYNKHLKEYRDRNVKEKLWGEVYVNVIRNWMELSGTEKHKKGIEIQKKWKNLKDCFARELATQRKLKSGKSAKKRRKYIYFDSLLFLLSTMKTRPTSGNTAPLDNNNGNNQKEQNTPTPRPMPLENNNNEDQVNTPAPTRRPKKSVQKISSYETTLLNILQQKQNEEIYEDKQFALMLIPMLQKLNDEQKHYAKVEILNVMRYAQNYHPPPVVQYPHIQRNNIIPSTSFASATGYQLPSQFPRSNFQVQPPGHVQTVYQSSRTNNQNQNPECSARSYYSEFSEDLLSPMGGSSSGDYSIASSPPLSDDNNSELFDM